MGVLEIAIAALSAMGALTATSAVMGAVMGSKRKIGSARGFLVGLLLPVVGVGVVALFKKETKPQSVELRHNADASLLSQDARNAAREQFKKDNPQTVKEEVRQTPVKKPKQEQTATIRMKR